MLFACTWEWGKMGKMVTSPVATVALKREVLPFPQAWSHSQLFPVSWPRLKLFQMLGRIGKRSPKWRWLKDKEGKARGNRTKEGPRTRVRTSGKTNNTPGWPNLHRTGPGREKHINRGAKSSSLSLSPLLALGRSSPGVFGSTCPHALKMDFPAIF